MATVPPVPRVPEGVTVTFSFAVIPEICVVAPVIRLPGVLNTTWEPLTQGDEYGPSPVELQVALVQDWPLVPPQYRVSARIACGIIMAKNINRVRDPDVVRADSPHPNALVFII
jgi:hypothetical protein